MRWCHGNKGGLGSVPIGAKERWERKEREAIESFAKQAATAAKRDAIKNQGVTDGKTLKCVALSI